MNAEGRAIAIEEELTSALFEHANGAMKVCSLRESVFRKILKQHILAAQREAVAERNKRDAKIITLIRTVQERCKRHNVEHLSRLELGEALRLLESSSTVDEKPEGEES